MMALRTAAILTMAGLALASCAAQRDRFEVPVLANPSSVVAAEIAFARLAQEEGQWTAFRKTATGDADMFVPQRVNAKQWLGGRDDPPQAVRWQPHTVYISCDGLAAVSTGAWQQPNGTEGYFTTVWRRQRDKSWEWVLDHGDRLQVPRATPDAIATRVAACGGSPPAMDSAQATGNDVKLGASRDRTLSWSSTVSADGSRIVTARLWNGTTYETVLEDRVSPE